MSDAGLCVDAGDTAWVLISSILILSMMPGLAFFEAGLLRSRDTSSIMMQILGGLSALAVLWFAFGFTLVFGPSQGGVIGNFKYVLLLGVDIDECFPNQEIPKAAYAMFEMMFAAIAPLLMTGAYAGRLKWKCFLIFTIAWEVLVYWPLANWIWSDGGWLNKLGVLDFAGGIVLHTSAGTGALICAIMVGRRKDFYTYMGEFPPSNIPLACIGAAMLWTGWFGFNAGSALTAGTVAANVVVNTQVASAGAALAWLVIPWVHDKPNIVDLANGAIAGLAGITPASGYINFQAAFILGLILGFGSYLSKWLIKTKLHIDDALDVSSVHGVTGIIGSLVIGLAATTAVNPKGANGAFYGAPAQLAYQGAGICVAILWSGFWTFLVLLILDKTIGLRVDEIVELEGLDKHEHNSSAYLFSASAHPADYESPAEFDKADFGFTHLSASVAPNNPATSEIVTPATSECTVQIVKQSFNENTALLHRHNHLQSESVEG